jgi:hypothetical protein
MSTSPQIAHEVFGVVLCRHDASELLLQVSAEGWQLPLIWRPPHVRVAQHLTSSIERYWNLRTYCLFFGCDKGSPDRRVPTYIAEVCDPDAEIPAAMRWLPVASLASARFKDQADFAAIQVSLARLDDYRHSSPGAFARPGWLRTVTEWVAGQAARFGLRLTGTFRQLNACPTFSLLRFETDGPALWFKAVGAPNEHEFSITLKLAQLLPEFLPQLVASKPDWNAWLSLEGSGTHLDIASPQTDWEKAACALASLQIASVGNGLHLIAAGCKDVRSCSLLMLVDPFFERMVELMKLQKKGAPAPLHPSEIASLAAEVRSGLEELADEQNPSVLGHLDVNTGNVLVSPERCVFLDWAEGCVGHPLFTFQYFLELRRKVYGRDHSRECAMLSAYSALWESFFHSRHIEADLPLIPLLAAFAYATSLSWRNPEACHGPMAGYLRSLVRRMKREADALPERRVACRS